MALFLETELKLRLTDTSMYDQLVSDKLYNSFCDESHRGEARYENSYYDTPDRRLLSCGLTMRIRKADTGFVATVKGLGKESGGLFVRDEWNQALRDENPSIDAFADLPIGPRLAGIVGQAALEPLFQTVFRRVSHPIRMKDAVIEVSIDQGHILAGGRSEPLCEIEFELKSGNAASLYELGATLAKRYPFMVERRSKFARGLVLAGIDAGPDRSAESAATPEPTLRNVMSARLLQAAQDVFTKQESLYNAPGDLEAIHDFRVSLRKLRALMAFVKPVLVFDAYADLNAKLRNLTNEFSYIRELDVLLDSWLLAKDGRPDAEASELRMLLRSERQQEHSRLLKAMISCAATPPLLKCCGAVLNDGLWLPEADLPFETSAVGRLNAWIAKFQKAVNAVSTNDLRQTHRLRILGKKIRAAQDLLMKEADILPSMMSLDLKQFLTLLGNQHDAGRNIEIVRKLAKANPSESLRREGRGFVHLQKAELKLLSARISHICHPEQQ